MIVNDCMEKIEEEPDDAEEPEEEMTENKGEFSGIIVGACRRISYVSSSASSGSFGSSYSSPFTYLSTMVPSSVESK